MYWGKLRTRSVAGSWPLASALLLAAAVLGLGGCASSRVSEGVGAGLQPGRAVPSGYGTFTVAISTNSNFVQSRRAPGAPWQYVVVQKLGQTKTLYRIGIGVPYIGRYQVAYGMLPPGKYRLKYLVHVTQSEGPTLYIPTGGALSIPMETGKFAHLHLTSILATRPFPVTANSNTDLGLFIYQPNSHGQVVAFSPRPRLHSQFPVFGWQPTPASLHGDEQEVLRHYTADAKTEPFVPWDNVDKRMAAIIRERALDNPAPTGQVKVWADGEIVMPSNFGRVLHRDAKHVWHRYDTGSMAPVLAADKLPDGRLIASIEHAGVFVHEPGGNSWKPFPAPSKPYAPTALGMLGNGKLFIAVPTSWAVTDRRGRKEHRYGMVAYVADPAKPAWHELARKEGATAAKADGTNVYLYAPSGALQATDYRTGQSVDGKLPGPVLIVGNDGVLLTLSAIRSNIGIGLGQISRDGGKNWSLVVRPHDYLDVGCPKCASAVRRLWPFWELDSGKELIMAPYEDSTHRWRVGYFSGPFGQRDLHQWRYVRQAQLPQCQFLAQGVLVGGKAWSICDDGEIWAYDPREAKPEHVRSYQEAQQPAGVQVSAGAGGK